MYKTSFSKIHISFPTRFPALSPQIPWQIDVSVLHLPSVAHKHDQAQSTLRLMWSQYFLELQLLLKAPFATGHPWTRHATVKRPTDKVWKQRNRNILSAGPLLVTAGQAVVVLWQRLHASLSFGLYDRRTGNAGFPFLPSVTRDWLVFTRQDYKSKPKRTATGSFSTTPTVSINSCC